MPLVQPSCVCLSALGQNLFPVKQAARNGVVPTFSMDTSRLQASTFSLPLQELGSNLYSFLLDLTHANATELVMQTRSDAAQPYGTETTKSQSQEPGRPDAMRQQCKLQQDSRILRCVRHGEDSPAGDHLKSADY